MSAGPSVGLILAGIRARRGGRSGEGQDVAVVLPRAVGAGFEPGKQSSKEKVEVLTFNNENDARSFVQLALGAGYTSKLLETAVGVAESVGAKRLQMRWDDLKIHERVAPRPVPAGGAPPAGAPPAAKGADDAASRRPGMSVVGE